MTRLPLLLLALAPLIVAVPARADRVAPVTNALYLEECGSCHLAFPPQLLDGASWRVLMGSLARHFGTDASVDRDRQAAIADYLARNGNSRNAAAWSNAGAASPRITETAYFRKKHRRLDEAMFRRSAVKGASNCAACHPGAARADFEDDDVRIPR